jgi:hypothetical protein
MGGSRAFEARRTGLNRQPRRGLRWALALVAIACAFVSGALAVLSGAAGGVGAAAAAAPAQQIGMKVLLVTDTASEVSYIDWQNTLRREGVPFDSVVTSTGGRLPALSSTAAGGTRVANYEGVVVATSGLEGLSTAEWTALQTFEHEFSVRQVTAYAFPSSDYGLTTPAAGQALPGASTALTLTASGAKTFPYLKAVALDPIGTFGYYATPLAKANVTTLISGPNGSSMLGIYTSPDGRQTMYQTFDENQYMIQSELLRHGELAWLARSTYFGDQRNYLETHIDDNFLGDDSWSVAGNATTSAHSTDFNAADALREVPSDVTTAAQWSAGHGFRIDMLFNGGGSVQFAQGCIDAAAGDNTTGGTSTACTGAATGTDPLLAAFQTTDPATGRPYSSDFGWISHTWDHPNLDEGCATQNYIEAELNQNTAWGSAGAAGGNPTGGGLGLAQTTDPGSTLGAENPSVVVTGEHSGLANLVPGNPGQVDPPDIDSTDAAATGGTLAAGSYEYAVADQFNTAAPGAAPVAGSGESAASISAPVTVTGATSSVTVSWAAVCHAADYIVYRAPVTGATVGAWSQIGVVNANTASDFTNPTGNSTTSTDGGGPVTKTFTDSGITGSPAPAGKPQRAGTAVESPYEQNPNLDAAFAGSAAGGIKYFGSDASKPYPSPADGSFPTGGFGGATTAAGSTFSDTGGLSIPRYPTNIYYNVSTNAQEVDEYQTLYDDPTCVPIAGVTTCNPAGTAFTIGQIIASADQNMFQHMMGNDPRPHYFHQTNLMSSQTSGVNGNGDGLFYETMNPLLTQYGTYFAGNAPIVQPTMPQIGTLLSEQSGWLARQGSVTGSIRGNVVTVSNQTGGALAIPLTGTTVGSPYAGGQSGWTTAPAGTSTYTALAAWPSPPTGPVIVQVPRGPSPTTHAVKKAKIVYLAVQVKPKTVRIRRGKVRVSLACRASRGKTRKGKVCRGRVVLRVSRHSLTHRFSFKSGKTDHVAIKLSKPVRRLAAAARRHRPRHRTLKAKLSIRTRLSAKSTRTRKGVLRIRP